MSVPDTDIVKQNPTISRGILIQSHVINETHEGSQMEIAFISETLDETLQNLIEVIDDNETEIPYQSVYNFFY